MLWLARGVASSGAPNVGAFDRPYCLNGFQLGFGFIQPLSAIVQSVTVFGLLVASMWFGLAFIDSRWELTAACIVAGFCFLAASLVTRWYFRLPRGHDVAMSAEFGRATDDDGTKRNDA